MIDQIRSGYRRTHETLLDVVRTTEPDALHRVFGTANSIAFNLWHVAKWDDGLFPALAEMSPAIRAALPDRYEVWVREGLAERWGLASTDLASGGAGTGLATEAAQTLGLPRDPGPILEYATQVFDKFRDELALLDEMALTAPASGKRAAPLDNVLYYWEHAARHLGMIEALKGVAGMKGSARG